MTELQELIKEVKDQTIGCNAVKVYDLLIKWDDDTDNEAEIREILWRAWMDETEESIHYLSGEEIEKCISEFGIQNALNLYREQNYHHKYPAMRDMLGCVVWDSFNEKELVADIRQAMYDKDGVGGGARN